MYVLWNETMKVHLTYSSWYRNFHGMMTVSYRLPATLQLCGRNCVIWVTYDGATAAADGGYNATMLFALLT